MPAKKKTATKGGKVADSIKKTPPGKAAGSKKPSTSAPLEREQVQTAGTSVSNKEALDTWSGHYNKSATKDKGAHTVIAHSNRLSYVTSLKCPSGIMGLDVDCGGGISANKLSIISGPDNSGKTFLANKYLAMHQRLHGHNSSIGIAAVETFDFWRARQIGLMVAVPDQLINERNEARRLIGEPELTREEIQYYKSQVGEVRFFRGDTGEETMNIVLEAVKSNLFGMIAIDSLTIMLPEADAEKDVGDAPRRAGNALLMTDFCRKYIPLTNSFDVANRTALIGLAQVRSNDEKATAGPLGKYMKDWKETGAWAVRHLKSVDIQIHNTGTLRNGEGVVIGKNINWNLVKGKDGTHDGIKGDVPYYHPPKFGQKGISTGTDDLGSIVTEGIKKGVYQMNGSEVRIVHPSTGERLDTIRNISMLTKMLASDFDWEMQQRRLILRAADITCLYTPLAS